MTTSSNELGEMIAAARKAKRILQRPAAKLMGISDTWLRFIEQGYQPGKDGGRLPVRPGADACWAIARVLDLDPVVLLTLAGHDPATPEPVAAEASPSDPLPRDDILNAILTDERLLPEARMHLASQYGLLLRIQPAQRAATAEQDRLDKELLDRLDREESAAERLRKPPSI
ncbi:MAG: hypothetical protein JWO69_2051 [Thermoleophilia bacterium]|nr:hypothetical protein [Thermoleophilia bacterium]